MNLRGRISSFVPEFRNTETYSDYWESIQEIIGKEKNYKGLHGNKDRIKFNGYQNIMSAISIRVTTRLELPPVSKILTS